METVAHHLAVLLLLKNMQFFHQSYYQKNYKKLLKQKHNKISQPKEKDIEISNPFDAIKKAIIESMIMIYFESFK